MKKVGCKSRVRLLSLLHDWILLPDCLTCLFFVSLCSFCRNWYCSIFIQYEIQLLLTSESKTFDLNRLFIIFFSWIMLDLLLSSSPASAVWGLCIVQLIGLAGTTRNSVKILLPISVRSSRIVYKFTRKLPGKPRTSPWSPAVFRPEACGLAGVLSDPHRKSCACSDPWTVQMSWN